MKTLKFFIVAVLITLGFLIFKPETRVDATFDNVCPEGEGWVKDNWNENEYQNTYNAPSNKYIDQVCVKGGVYKEYFNSDDEKRCWDVDFKNNSTEVKIKENNCKGSRYGEPDISHISYLLKSKVTPTPTIQVTPTIAVTPTIVEPTPTIVEPTPTVVVPTPTVEVQESTKSADYWDCSMNNSCEKKPEPPVCRDGSIVELPGNPHVVRNNDSADVIWFGTKGNLVDIYYKENTANNWTHAIGDLKNNEFNKITINSLKPELGYTFGIRQHQGCGGGETIIAVIIDPPATNKIFKLSFWSWF